VLGDLHALTGQHASLDHGHSTAVLRAMSGGQRGVRRSLDEMARRGWVREVGDEEWVLTPAGRAEAERQARQSSRRASG
jgi:hypothetical protein